MARTIRSDLAAARAATARTTGGTAGWVGGIVTGVQAAALSALALVALALVAAAAAPTPDGSIAVDWGGASNAAAHVWLLAFGVPVAGGGAVVDLVPLGLTFGIALTMHALAQRFAAPTLGSVLTAGVTLGGAVAATASALGAGAASAIQGAVWATLIGAVAAGLGVRRAHGVSVVPLPTLPAEARRAVRQGVAGAVGAFAIAAVMLFASVVAGWTDIGRAARALDADPIGGIVLAVGELAYIPTLVAWMLAWTSGLGFSVGSGSLYAPSELVTEPLPLIPILGGLPSAAGGPLVWAPLLLVALGFAARWLVGPRRDATKATFGATALAALVSAVLIAAAMAATTGSLGGGHLTVVGADWLAVGSVCGALLLAGGLAADGIAWWRGVSATARQAARLQTRQAGPSAPAQTPPHTA